MDPGSPPALSPGLLNRVAPGRLEDFITEAFAWLLSNVPELGESFVEYLRKEPNARVEIAPPEGTLLEWKTQVSLLCEGRGSVRPDMICEYAGQGIIFEHKTWSKLHGGQLDSYRKAGETEDALSDAPIVLITAHAGQHQQDPDVALCWVQIHRFLGKWLSGDRDPVARFLVCDFRALLKGRGLGPMKKIDSELIKRYSSFVRVKHDLARLLQAVSACFETESEVRVKERWGRYGFDVFDANGWFPGLFVGVLLDGADHRTEPSNKEKGPDACVILDVDRSLHGGLMRFAPYQRLVDDLKSDRYTLPHGWTVYNHLHEADSPNRWHPLHVRCPLVDVLGEASDAEEQVKRFYNDTHSIIEMIRGHASLEKKWEPASALG